MQIWRLNIWSWCTIIDKLAVKAICADGIMLLDVEIGCWNLVLEPTKDTFNGEEDTKLRFCSPTFCWPAKSASACWRPLGWIFPWSWIMAWLPCGGGGGGGGGGGNRCHHANEFEDQFDLYLLVALVSLSNFSDSDDPFQALPYLGLPHSPYFSLGPDRASLHSLHS